MSRCIFGCRAHVEESGDACEKCEPMLREDARCACGSVWPIKMVDGRPTCLGCLNAAYVAARLHDCAWCHVEVAKCSDAVSHRELCLDCARVA